MSDDVLNTDTAIGFLAGGPIGAMMGYQFNQAKGAQKEARNKIEAEKNAMIADRNWAQKKKDEQARNNSLAALRLRDRASGVGTTSATNTSVAAAPTNVFTNLLGGGGIVTGKQIGRAHV